MEIDKKPGAVLPESLQITASSKSFTLFCNGQGTVDAIQGMVSAIRQAGAWDEKPERMHQSWWEDCTPVVP